MGVSSDLLYSKASSFSEKFDVLPRLVDGVDYLTASWANTLLSGTSRLSQVIGVDPLTLTGVTWSPTGLDNAMMMLSRVEGGVGTLEEDTNGFLGQITVTADRFTASDPSEAGGTNPDVPLLLLVGYYQELSGKNAVHVYTAGEWQATPIYDDTTPFELQGWNVRTMSKAGEKETSAKFVWVAMEAEIG